MLDCDCLPPELFYFSIARFVGRQTPGGVDRFSFAVPQLHVVERHETGRKAGAGFNVVHFQSRIGPIENTVLPGRDQGGLNRRICCILGQNRIMLTVTAEVELPEEGFACRMPTTGSKLASWYKRRQF